MFVYCYYRYAIDRCEVLTQMNSSLEEDRRSLMQQVSILLTQYHELLTQTLEDKEHFHEEEKEYTDKVNNLNRQKEKLEEKIMEQYKKMDPISPKKPGLAGQLVRKITKASSNIMGTGNRVRSGSRGRAGQQVVGGAAGGAVGGGNAPRDLRRRRQQIGDDSVSSGSGNDSIDSGQHSPNGMARSESAVELRGRKINGSSGAGAGVNPAVAPGSGLLFRKSMPPPSSSSRLDEEEDEIEDSDGNHADNDSVNSFMSSGNSFLAHSMPQFVKILVHSTYSNDF